MHRESSLRHLLHGHDRGRDHALRADNGRATSWLMFKSLKGLMWRVPRKLRANAQSPPLQLRPSSLISLAKVTMQEEQDQITASNTDNSLDDIGEVSPGVKSRPLSTSHEEGLPVEHGLAQGMFLQNVPTVQEITSDIKVPCLLHIFRRARLWSVHLPLLNAKLLSGTRKPTTQLPPRKL